MLVRLFVRLRDRICILLHGIVKISDHEPELPLVSSQRMVSRHKKVRKSRKIDRIGVSCGSEIREGKFSK